VSVNGEKVGPLIIALKVNHILSDISGGGELFWVASYADMTHVLVNADVVYLHVAWECEVLKVDGTKVF